MTNTLAVYIIIGLILAALGFAYWVSYDDTQNGGAGGQPNREN